VFVAEMQRRDIQWKVPTDWNEREDLDIAEKITSYDKDSMEKVKEGLTKGTLRAVRIVKKK
jgi:hypothetical protein